jgi:hypothetical protein
MESSDYKVLWTTYTRVALARMQEYKVNPMTVFRRSKAVLANHPSSKADGVSDFPGFEFNGYYLVLIGNVVIVGRTPNRGFFLMGKHTLYSVISLYK